MTIAPANPGWVLDQVPTAAQWNSEWGSKQDWPTAIPDAITAFNIATPSTGGTVTMSVGQGSQIIDPAGTLATLTVHLPTSPVNGQIARVSTTQILSALTLNSTDGSTVKASPTTLSAGGKTSMLYQLSNTTWYPY